MNRKSIIVTIKNMIAQESRAKTIIRGMRRRLKAEHRAGHECACVSRHAAINGDMAYSRRTLRDLHLAYAYLRGVPYAVVERKCHVAPSLWGVGRTIWDVRGDKQAQQQPLHEDIKAWLVGRAPAWPSFPGDALVRYRRLQMAMERADDATWEELAARADVVWYTALSDDEHKLLDGEEAAADGRAA